MKWKVATAGVLTATFLSAPVANATPANGGGNAGSNNVGQAISQIVNIAGGGAGPGAILDAVNQVKGVLGRLGIGKRGNGKGVNARQAAEDTKANIGKTLRKPENNTADADSSAGAMDSAQIDVAP